MVAFPILMSGQSSKFWVVFFDNDICQWGPLEIFVAVSVFFLLVGQWKMWVQPYRFYLVIGVTFICGSWKELDWVSASEHLWHHELFNCSAEARYDIICCQVLFYIFTGTPLPLHWDSSVYISYILLLHFTPLPLWLSFYHPTENYFYWGVRPGTSRFKAG